MRNYLAHALSHTLAIATRHVADSGKAQHRGTGGGVEAPGPKQDILPELLPLPLLPAWLPP